MIILGLNAYHGDSSACIVVDGKFICAIEEERIRRIKHWAGLPIEAIKWCLNYTGIDIKDVDCIAISRNPYARLHKKAFKIIKNVYNYGFIRDRVQNVSKVKNIKDEIACALDIDCNKIKAKVYNVEHHSAHLGSTFLVSPYDRALCVTIDGFGDFVSTMRGIGENNRITIIDAVEYPHSLGIFYTAFTQFLGFWKYGDEYKVMGLSAFGEPVYENEMKKIVRMKDNGLFEIDTSFFLHDREGVEMTWLNAEPKIGRIFSDKFIDLFGKPRKEDEEISKKYMDIAASVQKIYEDTFFHILSDIYRKKRIEKICLAGGCIQNSLANGKIFEKTSFKEVYIPPAAHDAGTAIGAAFWIWNVVYKRKREFVMDTPYWGPEFSDEEIENALKDKDIKYEKLKDEEMLNKIAKNVTDGKIIGWFQERTELGPRALGNRSIVADPRRKEIKDILNARIKRREWFRPFAPSVLEEFAAEWFENNYHVPFMEKVYKIRPQKRELIPAVTHIDGTGRLQTVSKRTNLKYYNLIKEFYKLTGVPMVLNTSFNENEPIVNTPKEAIDCFLRTKMDILVIGNYVIAQKK